MGKNVCYDLLEGKVTLPLIFLLANGDANTKSLITAAIDKPKEADIAIIVNLVVTSDSLDYCRKLAHDYVSRAKSALGGLPDNNYRDALFNIAELSIERIK